MNHVDSWGGVFTSLHKSRYFTINGTLDAAGQYVFKVYHRGYGQVRVQRDQPRVKAADTAFSPAIKQRQREARCAISANYLLARSNGHAVGRNNRTSTRILPLAPYLIPESHIYSIQRMFWDVTSAWTKCVCDRMTRCQGSTGLEAICLQKSSWRFSVGMIH